METDTVAPIIVIYCIISYLTSLMITGEVGRPESRGESIQFLLFTVFWPIIIPLLLVFIIFFPIVSAIYTAITNKKL
jgi:hypothetical protein